MQGHLCVPGLVDVEQVLLVEVWVVPVSVLVQALVLEHILVGVVSSELFASLG